jgi:hypothetical protein
MTPRCGARKLWDRSLSLWFDITRRRFSFASPAMIFSFPRAMTYFNAGFSSSARF